MKKLLWLLTLLMTAAAVADAGDLYKVRVSGWTDAELLRRADVEPVYRISGAYLVLTDSKTATRLQESGIEMTLLGADIKIKEIAVDNRFDRRNADKHEVLFEEGYLRLFRVDDAAKARSIDGQPLIPIDNSRLEIEYRPPLQFNEKMYMPEISLDSLIDKVSQDSADLYLHRLEAFVSRLTGSDSILAARDWIAERFASYGYTPVIDTFTYNSEADTGYNVVAIKTGTRYPGRQIVVGGHYDGVPDVPAADDNGSGTVGTMEMARALADVETEMTFIFIAFDAEEGGLRGSASYAGEAAARGDTIVYMLNMDMIGHIDNDAYASLHQGPYDEPYAQLWGRLADSLVGIAGVITGPSGGSDHASFVNNGYDVTFVQEFNFSPNWHQPTDNTDHINFDYMTRMIKGSLATAYVVNMMPKPVIITSIQDVGDGHSLKINWEAGDPTQVDHFWLHYTTVPAAVPCSSLVPSDSASYVVDTLTEGQKYVFHMVAVDADGRSSVAFNQAYGTPYAIPAAPVGISAMPLRDSIKITWSANNAELDFDHYMVFRDESMIADLIYDTVYIDSDPALDTTMHEYLVAAVDIDGNVSDTTGAERASMKTATLNAGRIFAVNRSGSNAQAWINEVVTGEFIREALTGLNYDYFSDTSASNLNRAKLLNMIDYELVVIGAESGRGQDDIGVDPAFGGILEDIAYYLSLGGKIIIFGRWGDIETSYDVDTVYFTPNTYRFVYTDKFDIAYRILPLTYVNATQGSLESDLIGAHSQMTEYPDLVWDEVATVDHTGNFSGGISGIPCPSFPFLVGSDYEIIYTYNSLTDSLLTEGQPVAWRHLGPDNKYVFFEIPLTFMERPAAVTALRQAVTDMGLISDVDDDSPVAALPKVFSLAQNYPNPFNANTTIEFYNPGSKPTLVTLEVFNILGQRTRLLLDGPARPGINRVDWDGADDNGYQVATGIYFYRLKTETTSMTRKMLMLK